MRDEFFSGGSDILIYINSILKKFKIKNKIKKVAFASDGVGANNTVIGPGLCGCSAYVCKSLE